MDDIQKHVWDKLCEMSGEQVAQAMCDYHGTQLIGEDFYRFLVEDGYIMDELRLVDNEDEEEEEDYEDDMDKQLKDALKYVREHIDMELVNRCILESMRMRCPFSFAYPVVADDISDLLEEYGQDNELPEGWWYEHGDIDEIVDKL